MDTPAPADEGEPGNTSPFHSRILLFSFCLIVFFSCNQRKKEMPPAPPPQDTLVKQKAKPEINDTAAAKPVARKKIYLTFDDGPNKGTMNVLRAIKKEAIPVSFFIVGKHVFDSPEQKATWELLKQDSSIELCNHSFSHAGNRYTNFYKNPAGVIKDFDQSRDKLQFSNVVTRMPGRNAWRIGDHLRATDIKESKAAIDSVHKAGYEVMGWDIEWNFDHKTLVPDPDTALLLRRIHNFLNAGTTKTPGHLVLLAHDQSFQKEENVAILIAFLHALKSDPEYEFMVASKYPGIKKDLP
jgi:peptidoglycan/xylan/chitin deacetylase (PgdA/CDA1 family)